MCEKVANITNNIWKSVCCLSMSLYHENIVVTLIYKEDTLYYRAMREIKENPNGHADSKAPY